MKDEGHLKREVDARFQRDRQVWESCAQTYEQRVVGGHPDVLAYEEFEEDLLDRVLRWLAVDGFAVRLYDVGCGSGRLHLRFGLQTADERGLAAADAARVRAARRLHRHGAYDELLAARLVDVGGIDFSQPMLDLAAGKLREAGLGPALAEGRLRLDLGSAFALPPFGSGALPVVACCCNSIGVMQGPEGAMRLFASMRAAVEPHGGIAIISAYRRAAVVEQALGNYESTMDVCGQPEWLAPHDFPAPRWRKVPLRWKRAGDPAAEIEVDVHDADGVIVHRGVRLRRDPEVVARVVRSGHIRTETDYESRWYDDEQVQRWIDELWGGRGVRIDAGRIDALRAAPAQLAIYDPNGVLAPLVSRWTSR